MKITDWVIPDSAFLDAWLGTDPDDDNESIIGRVVAIDPDGDVQVAWLSNERGLWRNWECPIDIRVVDQPPLGLVEAIMVSCVPTFPATRDT